jgi:hypothetical protein
LEAGLEKAPLVLRRTLAERFDGKKTEEHNLAGVQPARRPPQKPFAKNFQTAGNKPGRGTVLDIAASAAFRTGFKGKTNQ